MFRHRIDEQFARHFKKLKQVFLYVTDECNLECEQCIYKPSITFQLAPFIPFDRAVDLIADFRFLGASKLTLLGGEPTLYGMQEDHAPLRQLIVEAKILGYQYVRMDTNGQFSPALFDKSGMERLDEWAFSIEGPSDELNDPIRGKNTFRNSVDRLRRAITKGYKCTITCCVHRDLLHRDSEGVLLLERMILFAQDLGVRVINFHDLFKVGVPMDTWTGQLAPTPLEWMPVYAELKAKIDAGRFSISVRLPQCFVTKDEFASNPAYYGYCPVKLGERVMVHPNGTIRICSNLICTAFGVARFFEDRIAWDPTTANELSEHKLHLYTPCTNRSRHRTYGDLVPVCFSFKPDQDEHVWRNELHWDERRTLTFSDLDHVIAVGPGGRN